MSNVENFDDLSAVITTIHSYLNIISVKSSLCRAGNVRWVNPVLVSEEWVMGGVFSLVKDSVTCIYKSSFSHPLFPFCSWRIGRIYLVVLLSPVCRVLPFSSLFFNLYEFSVLLLLPG